MAKRANKITHKAVARDASTGKFVTYTASASTSAFAFYANNPKARKAAVSRFETRLSENAKSASKKKRA